MEVICTALREGILASRGMVVVVDVYRAFTCTSWLFALGVERSILVRTPEEAFALKNKDPQVILVGEVDGRPIEGFDLGNSPSQILRLGSDALKGRTAVQRSSAGVQGVLLAMDRADVVLLAGYNNALATARHISSLAPSEVWIVATGRNLFESAPEDEWCARYLSHLLGVGDYDHRRAMREVLFAETTQRFLRGQESDFPPEDPVLCLQQDLFPFVLKAHHEEAAVVVQSDAPP